MGRSESLATLLDIFDMEAAQVGDHIVVELFGFLDDWENTGRRLVKHAKTSDGAATELLCSALMWRRYLEGEKVFKENWYKYSRLEKLQPRKRDHLFESCH